MILSLKNTESSQSFASLHLTFAPIWFAIMPTSGESVETITSALNTFWGQKYYRSVDSILRQVQFIAVIFIISFLYYTLYSQKAHLKLNNK